MPMRGKQCESPLQTGGQGVGQPGEGISVSGKSQKARDHGTKDF